MASVYVRFTTTGASFNPTIELWADAIGSARWVCEEDLTELTGNDPTFTWGSAAVRHVRLFVEVTPGGTDILSDVRVLNLGYHWYNDAGNYRACREGTTDYDDYEKDSQALSAIEGIANLTDLYAVMANNTTLSGTLDFTNMTMLQFVEFYYADLTEVFFDGCSSIVRICTENCSLSTINLNPVASTIRDFRGAIQNSASLTFVELTSDLINLYHLCVRDQIVLNLPPASRLPAVEELWIWNTGQTGTLVTGPSVTSCLAYGNGFTAADISASTNIVSCTLYGNNLTTTFVDLILITLNGFSGFTGNSHSVNLTGNAGPSANGVAAANSLIAKGVVVSIESEASNGVRVDDFNRADGVPGNGWHALTGGQGTLASGTISTNRLQRLDNSAYQIFGNPGGGNLPADYTVYAIVPHSTTTTYFGLFGRWSGGNGVRLLFTTSRTTITVGEAYDYAQSNISLITDNAFPSSWTVDQPHLIAMKMTGTLIEIFVDGVLVRHGTMSLNSTATGTEYGICGEGSNRYWDEIGTIVEIPISSQTDTGFETIVSISGIGSVSSSHPLGVDTSAQASALVDIVSDNSIGIEQSGSLSGIGELVSDLPISIGMSGSFESEEETIDIYSDHSISLVMSESINGTGSIMSNTLMSVDMEAMTSLDSMRVEFSLTVSNGFEIAGEGHLSSSIQLNVDHNSLVLEIEAGPIFSDHSISTTMESYLFSDGLIASEHDFGIEVDGQIQDTGLDTIVLRSVNSADLITVIPFSTVRIWDSNGFEIPLGIDQTTDITGSIVFEVPSGTYRILVEKPGFGFDPLVIDVLNEVLTIVVGGISFESNWLQWEDLESVVDNSVIDRLFNDTNTSSRKWKLLEYAILQAQGLAESQLLRSWNRQQIALMAANDPSMRAQAAWLALEAASERRQEFISADGKGRYWAQYERSMSYFKELSKSKSHSQGEEAAGHGSNAGGSLRPALRPRQARRIFADEPDGSGHGGF